MALSTKTEEADRLARELSSLTGETMTEAVTRALAERLAREHAAREAEAGLPARIKAFAERIRPHYDTRRSPKTSGIGPAATNSTPCSSSILWRSSR